MNKILLTIIATFILSISAFGQTNQCVSGNCVNGKGKMVYDNGDIYEGNFVNGKKEGQGTFTYKYGTVYVGRFANDKFNGKGKLNYTDGEIYDGNFVNGKKEGQATHTYTNGNYYTGEFKNDKQDGYGKFYNKATNTTQEGTWKDDDFVDATTAATTPPPTSNGCVSGNCVNGKGKMVYTNGDIYEGDYVNGNSEGQGVYTAKNGDIYQGNFVNGNYEGKGTYTFKDGDYYTGEWKDSSRNGYGKEFTKATDTFREGTWKDGVLVNSTDASVQANLNRENLLNKIEVYSKSVRGLGNEIDTLAAELKTNTSTPARVKELYNLIEQYSLKILTARQQALKVLNLEPESAEKTDLKKLVEESIAAMNTNLKAVEQWKDLELKDKSTASTKCVSGDCVNGKGKIVYTNGDIYDGDFVDGKKVGQGTYTYKNGQIYVGRFFDNLRSGKGKFTFSDGNTYEGSFVSDNFIGHGTYTSKSGSNQTGKFTVGQIVDLQIEIVGTYFWGKAEIIEILGDKYKVRDLKFHTIETVTEQKIRPFTIPVKYEIGQKVEVLNLGIWYKGEIIALEIESNDHYRIRFENALESSEYVRYIRPGIASSNAQTKVTSNQTTANTNGSSNGNDILSNAKEAAVDANLVAKKAVIDSITKSAGAKKTNKERIEPAKQMLKLQNELVQYLTDALNGNDLSETAKAKYRKPLETEKLKVRQFENLLNLTIEAAKYEQ